MMNHSKTHSPTGRSSCTQLRQGETLCLCSERRREARRNQARVQGRNSVYVITEMTPRLIADAMSSARRHGLRAYDAVQLAAALEVNRFHQTAGVGPVTLISADRELNAAATAEGWPSMTRTRIRDDSLRSGPSKRKRGPSSRLGTAHRVTASA
jgi:hypothetical protein